MRDHFYFLPSKPVFQSLGLAILLFLGTSQPFAFAEEGKAEAKSAEADATPKAEEPQEETKKRQLGAFDRVEVVGDSEKASSIPGAAQILDSEHLERQQNSDIHRILRDVPGINIQEEDGYGLRPNIGFRGTGVERSQKITLMEDGVLIAPAPYSAPAAYYFPMAGRMESIEVLKGSSQIKYGPNTNGGALNMVSSSIPASFRGTLSVSGGNDMLPQAYAKVGDSRERYGWLLETHQTRAQGFKDLDGGGSTGFHIQDYMLKVRLNTAAQTRIYQQLELKLGATDEISDETYLGLTKADFEETPYRRYAASQKDKMDAQHWQFQLRHLLQPSEGFDLTTTVYRTNFSRNWYKLDRVASKSLSAVLDQPENYAAEYAVLAGGDSNTGVLEVKANNRDYYALGLESIAGFNFKTGGVTHDLEAGVRLHRDEEDRFMHSDKYHMVDGKMVLSQAGTPGTGSGNNRVGSAEALALFVHDTLEVGRLMLRPGMRFETIRFEQTDYGASDPAREGATAKVVETKVNELMPGLGVGFRLNGQVRLFAGVHKGFSPPGPGAVEGTKSEESLNYELGMRWQDAALHTEVVGFYSDYSNLLGADTNSGGGGGTGALFNGGAVSVAGLESSVQYDLGVGRNSGVSVPLRLSYTYTQGEFESSFKSAFPDWSPEVQKGDAVPYLPKHQLALSGAVEQERWGGGLSAAYVGEMRIKAGSATPTDAERVESHFVLDASGYFMLRPNARLFLNARNVLDETYVVAIRPAGLRPGLPRTISAGVKFGF